MLRSLVGDSCREVVEMPNIFHPYNTIVAGGCGFIGSNFGHCAAEFHNDNSIADPEPFLRANGEGAFLLLEADRRCGRFGMRVGRGPLNCRRSKFSLSYILRYI
ncbi:hypothetical protein [Parolsenella sp.]|uniref:hypothetical protein n=1 Tax=Parolsenella sp. TaxID=2083006 RepID=UPI002E7855EC|nr:hypothetical protein [Parolsenella sp.]